MVRFDRSVALYLDLEMDPMSPSHSAGWIPVEFVSDANLLFVPAISEHVWIAEQAFA